MRIFFVILIEYVRCIVVTSITKIVLRFGRINNDLVKKVVENASADPDLGVHAIIAEDLIEDLEVNLIDYNK